MGVAREGVKGERSVALAPERDFLEMKAWGIRLSNEDMWTRVKQPKRLTYRL